MGTKVKQENEQPPAVRLLLHLPTRWDDLRKPKAELHRSDLVGGANVLVWGRLKVKQYAWQDRPPRLKAQIRLESGQQVPGVAFGNLRYWQEWLARHGEHACYLYGTLKHYRGQWSITLKEVVGREWVGYLRPVYKGYKDGNDRSLKGDELRSVVLGALDGHMGSCLDHLTEKTGVRLAKLTATAGCPQWTAEQMVRQAHLPDDEAAGRLAHECLDRLAALATRRAIQREPRYRVLRGRLRDWASVGGRISRLPFRLTNDQHLSVLQIMGQMRGDYVMRHVLSGDVGTGKTAVYGVVGSCVVETGGRTCVLLPNRVLAEEIGRELASWWPEQEMELVTGAGTENLTETVAVGTRQGRWVIGTSAILSRYAPGYFDLVVVDEQQKFAREQRERLMAQGTHLLECTATCIPRTQALLEYGGVGVSRLRETPVEKEIVTRLYTAQDRRKLFALVGDTIAGGGKVLVVYALKTKGSGGRRGGVQDATGALSMWDAHWPGRVRFIRGGVRGDENTEALRAVKNDEADILVSTTAAEVGLNIPRLERVLVINPERLGLSTLHQLRGRVARKGGRGYCDLYLPKAVSEASLERLRILVETTDGFELARRDLELRGGGDVRDGGDRQSGHHNVLLPGRVLRMDLLPEEERHV